MTTLLMLDTDVASYIIKAHPRQVRNEIDAVARERLCLSALTQGELLFGLKRLPPDSRLQALVRRFLDQVRVLPWPVEAADHYAEIRHRLSATGRLIGQIDMLIAAHALAADATVMTNNLRHFERVGPSLKLRPWARA